MLEIQHLCTGYAGKQILHQVDLAIPENKVTVILGPNGCGKSTLLKTLCGIVPVQQGQIRLHGEDLLRLKPKDRAKRISYLAQGQQLPHITAYALVQQGRFPHVSYPFRYRKSDHGRAQAAMEQMGIWEHRDTLLEELSGGQRQKVYLAMALAQDTSVILLDEPATYLDISHQLQLMALFRELSRRDKTVVTVIHDIAHAFQIADQLVLMRDGKIICQGTPEEVYASGTLEAVFQVRLCRSRTPLGWHYYCEASE